MTEPIKIEVETEGAEQAATSIDGVSQSLGNMAEQGTQASASTSQLALQQAAAAAKAIEFGSKLAAAASAIQGITSALGVEGRAAGLVGQITQTSVAMAQLGQQFGPQGALVGGAIGAVIPALAAVRSAMEETEQRNQEWRERLAEIEEAQQAAEEAIRDATAAIEEQSRALDTANERMREFIDSLSTNGLEDQAFNTAAQITELTDRLGDVNDELAALEGSTGVAAAARILDLREEAASLTTTINGLTQSFEGIQTQLSESRPRSRSGARDERGQAEERAWLEDLEYARAEQERLIEELDRDMVDALGGVADAEAVIAGIIADQNDEKQRSIELTESQKEAAERLSEARTEAKDREAELALERRNQVQEDYNQLFQVGQSVTQLLTDSIGEVLKGTQSADEAMLGLLKSFLEFISQFAALKAAAEFADAAASFAKYDYGGGALHIAAGVAFTAVAVATGVGAAQINTAPAQPAKPSQEGTSSGGKGGDVVINYNSPVITAATYAELGREQRNLIRAAESRFGR